MPAAFCNLRLTMEMERMDQMRRRKSNSTIIQGLLSATHRSSVSVQTRRKMGTAWKRSQLHWIKSVKGSCETADLEREQNSLAID